MSIYGHWGSRSMYMYIYIYSLFMYLYNYKVIYFYVGKGGDMYLYRILGFIHEFYRVL